MTVIACHAQGHVQGRAPAHDSFFAGMLQKHDYVLRYDDNTYWEMNKQMFVRILGIE